MAIQRQSLQLFEKEGAFVQPQYSFNSIAVMLRRAWSD
jgi:hypothetical protein